ncbi:unnamed protein product [Peniophora sp. CBMAI 1063]|nr:unnamed protein product [Peniophora sp. CBMAI 1063]
MGLILSCVSPGQITTGFHEGDQPAIEASTTLEQQRSPEDESDLVDLNKTKEMPERNYEMMRNTKFADGEWR